MSAVIAEVQARLRVRPEFKFNKCSYAVRDGFFEAVAPFTFGVRALVVDKANIYSPHLREATDGFYNSVR